MKQATKPSYELNDEEVSAELADVLGADGGSASAATGTDLSIFEGDFDDEWLDEELTDEELAALGEDDFEAAFSDELDDAGLADGDLGDLDDLDDFELMDDDDEAPKMLEAAPSFPENDEVSGEFGDDLFEIADSEPVVTAGAGAPEPEYGEEFGEELAEPQAPQQENYESDFSDDRLDDYGDEETLNFEENAEFSIDDDLSEEANPEVKGPTAVVRVDRSGNELREQKSGGVVAADDEVSNATDMDYGDDDIDEDDSEFADADDDGTFHRPVPRIQIHAFCETSRNSAILEKAAVDRRLSKAHFTMQLGGLEKAIELYQTTSTPNLIILETTSGGGELIQQLGHLAEVCDPSTKVVIIGRVNDIRLYRELIRQGISEYIVRPKSPLQIIKAISELYVDPSAPPIGKTVAFVGARGGVGSSTLAHNVGYVFAEEFKSDTVILDLDLPFGTAALDFDHEPTSGLIEALTSPERLDDVLLERLLQKHSDHLSLFTAPNMLDRDYDIDDEAFDTVIDVVRGTAPTVVIDVPHNWTGWSKKILQTADEIVITATPDFASFRNMKYLLEVIGSARPNDSKPYFIYNQFDPKTSAVPVEYFVENVEIEPTLVLGWEPQLFNAAATTASPVVQMSPKSKVAQGLNELSAKILGRNETLALPSRFSLTSLFKRK